MSISARRRNRVAPLVPAAISTPSAAQNVSVSYTSGDSRVVLSWSPPVSDGHSPITGYLLARDNGSGIEDAPWSGTYPADSRTLDFLNLKTGTYVLSVTPQNSLGNGPATTVTVNVSATPVAPAAASAAGFTTASMNDEFTSSSTIDFAGTSRAGQGYNWTVQQPFRNDPPAISDSPDLVKNSILTLLQTNGNYNQALFTSNRVTQSHLIGPFQYGYYEARMKFDPATVGDGGWPSFWSIGASHVLLQNSTRWPELDFFEFAKDISKASGGVFAASIHDHISQTTDNWNGGNNTVDVNPDTWNRWHLYGCLWQPGSIKWYFDNTLIKTQTYTATTQTPPSTNGGPAGTYTILDDPTDGPATIIIGSGASSPLLVDWVRVWQ